MTVHDSTAATSSSYQCYAAAAAESHLLTRHGSSPSQNPDGRLLLLLLLLAKVQQIEHGYCTAACVLTKHGSATPHIQQQLLAQNRQSPAAAAA
jgi:hypothetical protein